MLAVFKMEELKSSWETLYTWVSKSVQAAITKYHRLGSSSATEIYFSQFVSLEKTKITVPAGLVSCKGPFLDS